MAGGKGARLMPYTLVLPKPLYLLIKNLLLIILSIGLRSIVSKNSLLLLIINLKF